MTSINGNGHAENQATDVTKTTRMLTVADILAASDITEEIVDVPEWGGPVTIRGLTKAKQHELRGMSTDPRTGQIDTNKLEMQLFIHGVVDPKIEPIQATELLQKSAGAIDRVLKRIMTISGMSEEAVKDAQKSLS